MNKIIKTALIVFAVTKIHANTTPLLNEIDNLIEQRKYEQAFKLILLKEEKPISLAFFVRKLDLSLNFSVRVIGGGQFFADKKLIGGSDTFAFTDLLPGESIDRLRQMPAQRGYVIFGWSIGDDLGRLLEENPKHITLQRLAAQYLFKYCAGGRNMNADLQSLACKRLDEGGDLWLKNSNWSQDACIERIRYKIKRGLMSDAEQFLEKCQKRFQESWQLDFYRAYVYSAQKKIPEAIISANSSIKHTQTKAQKIEVLSYLGSLYAESKQYSAASQSYFEAYELDKSEKYALGKRIEMLLRLEELEKAERQFRNELLIANNEIPKTLNFVREAYRTSGQINRYLKILDEESALAEKKPHFYSNLRLAYIYVTSEKLLLR